MEVYEKLGAFYLGRRFDIDAGDTTPELLLYDAKDLTTHAVCVGMTGSGKTGLCVTLLEEAALDGIPSIVIDPKGDIGNLMLTFPDLKPGDFRPWIDESEARRKGMTPDEYASNRASLWKNGLAKWDQDGERIRRLRDAVDISIYTPGSDAGRSLTVLRSLSAPPAALLEDRDAMRERVTSAVSGLLALLGIDADPIRSREHILLSSILDHAWREGRDLQIAALINLIQTPPFDRIGVMDVDSFFPAKDRFALAMSLNGLIAAPGFQAWMEGEAMNIDRLMYTEEGKPRISILSIAHLSDAERMFFVTLLLNEVVAWMRTQPGTSSLRALLYMDEVFGFFPPVANPPSKTPLLTLMKQARAFGLGVMLATQNPVDLDYKGLSNAGTWFLGRLQTERDKKRVIEGLEGASAAAGSAFDRSRMEKILAGLGSRVFVMNNVHEDEPMLFHTRWAMSYLRGPLTRHQIQMLMADQKATVDARPASAPVGSAPAAATPPAPSRVASAFASVAPPLPPEINVRYLPVVMPPGAGEQLVYKPALIGSARLHYVRTAAKLDDWKECTLFTLLSDDVISAPWEDADQLDVLPDLWPEPLPQSGFDSLPGRAGKTSQFTAWKRSLKDTLYRTRDLPLYHCPSLKSYGLFAEDERSFRIRLREKLREKRDLTIEKLRKRYTPKIATLQDRVRKAEQRVEVESAQAKQQGLSTIVDIGSTVLGALFGRKVKSSGTVRSAGSAMKKAQRTGKERADIERARENLESLRQRLQDLEAEFEQELKDVELSLDIDELEISEITLRPRKGDMSIRHLGLVWVPSRTRDGQALEPAFSL
ncbi:MAG: DUF87 domain-containing protein [Planctomycetota bacterium]